ncbi:hypothetical protein COX95_00995 [bacterium CG_4_10_14_0_2_um_filter_33_32]|nr:MAG: hypothetical protein AUJ93_01135 [bacterium CG2_30_33_46]PIU76872.1 MAG: hypothetical protein COS74_01645 [bacterium CG06_land_8_20_14_3_00_33_50]PIW81683.1 MAG: hypothetical protein COZ97_00610 [bacterium CG_4_8_14_3_um_filter_33_28]PIY84993.1 MAG: hypothetical protein COY76_04605 [bacterium CG_4_10_14_0_8_um_filter_33_57]PIZ86553.1 MAG: hypothetical protein COX95_00995 [bacterium CG_4_10_14_0_2_um_filter_33_32]PJA72204.1 MAG: hypothetical protein CO152_02525 [bacterium CG_4_9_14_3_um
MPTVNIYYKNSEEELKIEFLVENLKRYLAGELSCKDIRLKPDEISVRLLKVNGDGMLGLIELEVKVHQFKDRVKRQDKICKNIVNFIRTQEPTFKNIKVWLILSELGHSW